MSMPMGKHRSQQQRDAQARRAAALNGRSLASARSFRFAKPVTLAIAATVVTLAALMSAGLGASPRLPAVRTSMITVAVAATSSERTGPPCPDVMVIAARGSGEDPQDNWSSPGAYPGDDNKGAGVPLYDTYKRLKAANPGLQFALEPVVYEAPPVSQLFSDPNNYLLSPRRGAFTALEDINTTEQFCDGGVKYLLLGYSSGAWLIHILLHQMPNKLFNKVVGVGLYGDPQYQPGLAIDRDYRLSDKLVGVAWAGDPTDRSIPKSLGSVTYDACLPNDPVCQAPNPVTAVKCKNNDPACPHTRYVTDGVTELVADFLDRSLPSSSVWPAITSRRAPNGRVGTSYSWTPTVRPSARATYQWSEVGTLPPGLSFSSTTGAVTGTPAKAGIYSFSVTATSAQQRTATQFESVVIDSGGPLAIAPSSLSGATVGTPYRATFQGTGGYLPYTWRATGTALDHGLNFTWIQADTTTATLSGTPDQAGTYSLNVTLAGAKGGTTTRSYSFTVDSAPTPTPVGSWNIQATPNPSAGSSNVFHGVSCTSPSNCIAVGSYFATISDYPAPLAERWDGSTWTAQSMTDLPGSAGLEGVSCTSPSSCTAVGSYRSGGNQWSLAAYWNGAAWSTQATPNPSGGSGYILTGVSCTSAASCTAVGGYFNAAGTWVLLAERWDGSAWSIQDVPNPSSDSASFNGVSCASATNCTAVGSYNVYTDNGGIQALVEHWDGSAWSVQDTPIPPGGSDHPLYGVSCVSATSCTAVGGYVARGNWQPLAEYWDGNAWSIQAFPAESSGWILYGISCPSAANCTAVGTYGFGYDAQAEHWDGNTWSAQAVVNPSSGGSFPYNRLNGVSCTTASNCAAVGYYTDTNGTDLTLAEST
jgi:putative Ig domain-containing protein/cutinase